MASFNPETAVNHFLATNMEDTGWSRRVNVASHDLTTPQSGLVRQPDVPLSSESASEDEPEDLEENILT